MFRKLISTTALALAALSMTSTATAFSVESEGLGIDVSYSLSGQTASFTFVADFTGATTSWIGDTMDSFSLQFGGGNGVLIDSFDATPTTTVSGNWAGFLDKVSGNGCSVNDFDAICYTALPTAQGGDGAPIITATTYTWEFDVTFEAGVDVPAVLSGDHSIKFLAMKEGPNENNPWTTGGQLSEEGPFVEDDTPGPLPEPISLALLGAGLAGLGLARRRSTRQ